jgi:beta-glucosidase
LSITRKMMVCASLLFSANVLAWGAQSDAEHGLKDAEISARVEGILKQMTLQEKIGQLSLQFVFGPSASIESNLAKGELGSLLFVTDPHERNRLQHIAVEQSRLHIPLIFGFDVIHGFRTIFPVPIGMAASWEPELSKTSQAIAAREASAVGISWAFAPMVDIARDPRWGRIVEGSGEDPYLGSQMAAAQVKGFQGEYIGQPDHLLACVKHFAGYGAAIGGRDYDESNLSEAQLRNVYLPPFHAAVKAGVGSVMTAYMDLNDVPATANRWLLHDVLRSEWGFKGLVVSDANAVKDLTSHGFAANNQDAAVRALKAGLDMEMSNGPSAISTKLKSSYEEGMVDLQQIEDADRYILEAKIRMGLFEHPYVDEAHAVSILNSRDSREEARSAAQRSAVLLRNEEHVLPLHPKGKKIAVIGPLADSKVDTLGPWSFQDDLQETLTVLDGLRSKFGTVSEISFAPGVQIPPRFVPSPFAMLFPKKTGEQWNAERAAQESAKAVQLASSSDLAILVLGEEQDMSGEYASRTSLKLPGDQENLLKAVVATGKPVVLILLNGRPLDLRWASQHVPAILEVWYPGTQGGIAVADLLDGSAVPGGKLPFTWPRDVGQIPTTYDHNLTMHPNDQDKRYWDEPSTPLYSFGYGLSYSTFSISKLQMDKQQIAPKETLAVTAEVENTGSMKADEVVQLYIHQRSGGSSRPIRQLKGFERVTLAPHERRTVRFTLGPDELAYWSSESRSLVNDSAAFDVWVGFDSQALLHGSFAVN